MTFKPFTGTIAIGLIIVVLSFYPLSKRLPDQASQKGEFRGWAGASLPTLPKWNNLCFSENLPFEFYSR